MLNELAGMKILIADDDPVSQALLQGLLEREGYVPIRCADSGEQALRMIEEDPPDLLLLDVYMPGMKGYEVCMAVRIHERTSHIPVIMITGGATEADEAIQKSFEAGATDFIAKPIRAIEFVLRVKASLSLKRNHDLLRDELSRREQAEREKERSIEQLRQALQDVTQLSGLLPICSRCKKIRDDQGYWNRIETYLREHADAMSTHGLCPACQQEFHPDLGMMN